jgi:signal transduction histidine kinase
VAASGQITSDRTDLTLAATEQSEAQRRYATFFEQAATDFKALLRNAQSAASARAADDLAQRLLATPAGQVTTTIDGTRLVDLVTQRLQGELEVEREISKQLLDEATAKESKANSTVRFYLLGTSLGILAALGLAFLVARATVRPLRQLTDAANQLAGQQLPRLVERLRDPDADTASVRLAPIPVHSRDEIGQLAKAFNDIQQVTTEVADEQTSLLRKGISDIFVNLARRNQALLDRQIEFIDQLESNEADPDQLDNLFRLDHLATRMRRNAESLLVLAGAEPPRRRGRSVPLADVVRVAIGEVEDFARVNLLALDEVTVTANVAVDLSHVVAELMDNATQFSPPETLVEVVGHRTRGDSYVLSVSDQGIGMSAEQLAEANQQLAQPPLMGLSLGRSLGFIVISRLAARHAISVRLTTSPSDGITSLVTLPAHLLGDAPGTVTEPAAMAPPGRRAARPVEAAAASDGDGQAAAPLAPPVPGEPRLPEPVLVGRTSNGHAGAELRPLRLPVAATLESDRLEEAAAPDTAESVESGQAAEAVVSEALADAGTEPSTAPTSRYENGSDPVRALDTGAGRGAGQPASSDGGASFTYNDIGETELGVPQVSSRPTLPRWSLDIEEPPTWTAAPERRDPAEPAEPASAEPVTAGAAEVALTSTGERNEPEARVEGMPSGLQEPGGLSLPRRVSGLDRSSAAGTTLGSAPAERAPVTSELVSEAQPASATSAAGETAESTPVHHGELVAGHAVDVGPRPGELTAAGLVRRSPKQQIRDLAASAANLQAARVVGSQRSPEEVRRMLSRYRTGLQRGRSPVQPGGPSQGKASGSGQTSEERK